MIICIHNWPNHSSADILNIERFQMNELAEKLLRDMLGDLVASKGAARKVITENIVTFVKKVVAEHSAHPTPKSGSTTSPNVGG